MRVLKSMLHRSASRLLRPKGCSQKQLVL